MRILQVTPAFPPSGYGGVSAHVGSLASGLARHGHDIWVATTNRYDVSRVMAFAGPREFDGVRVYYAKAHWPSRYFFAPKVLGILERWIEHSDVVHVHDTRTFLGLAAYLTAKQSRVPFVVTCHGSLNRRTGSTLLKELHDHVVGKGLVTSAARVIALNEAELSDMLDFGVPQEKIVVIPNAIPFAEGRIPQTRGKPEGQTLRIKTILYLGRIHPIKGIDRLIDAFALIAARRSDCQLMVVGQNYGAQKGLVRKVREHGLQRRVMFPGAVYGEEKARLLETADVLVLPSYADTFPLVVLEAFSARVPVVLSTTCGIARDLEKNNAALLGSSVSEFAEAIELCLYDDSTAERLRRNGLHLLETKYNWQHTLSQLETIYDEVLK